MPKVTEAQVLKIYHKAWLDVDIAELAKKYNVTDSAIRAIKHGRAWSSVTGHVPNTVPRFIILRKHKIYSDEEKKARRDALTKEVLVQYEGIMALDECYIQLIDDDVEGAIEFKASFWQYRAEKGLRELRFPKSEVQEFYEGFKNRK